ncbi:hypothetical protein V5N11_011321 [Cardamine amara subsp. amara]|uniref:Uncharacterized protein n=1 Tax=Cardamine amara subsp. amara TaxID=228776 RepID=A0ABD1AF68_CARAN
MARISLLLSLAFVLALGSLFLSVSGHASPALPRKSSCPKTVSELQTLPFIKITKILNQKERFAPKTAEFKAMFTMCKGYVAYLESLYKFENPIVDVLGIAKTRYALMTKAILAAEASVSGKVDKKTSLKLKKSSADFTKGFLTIKELIVKISAKHQYKADAKLNASESKKLDNALIKFKNSINDFLNVVNNLEKKKMKKLGHHARALKEDHQKSDRVRKFFESFYNKFGGKTHGRELSEVDANAYVGADIKGFGAFYEKFSHFFGGYLGGKPNEPHGRQLYTGGAEASGKVKDSLEAFLNAGYGGKVQFDAAGKMKATGGDGFRSLNRAQYKRFASTEA